jgi:hypothetical protein
MVVLSTECSDGTGDTCTRRSKETVVVEGDEGIECADLISDRGGGLTGCPLSEAGDTGISSDRWLAGDEAEIEPARLFSADAFLDGP